MPFSIAGRCSRTGQLGVAVASPEIAAGGRSPWVRGRAVAVAVQNLADPQLAAETLDLLWSGLDAEATLNLLTAGRQDIRYRQILVVDAQGSTAHFSGEAVEPPARVKAGANVIAGGCRLPAAGVVDAMVQAFDAAAGGDLGECLVAGLLAGVAEAGDAAAIHSAALLVAAEQPWPLIDLRVDWHESLAVQILEGLWLAYRAQAEDFVKGAVDPGGVLQRGLLGGS